MADAVATIDVFSGKDYLIRRITNISDGTGESGVAKVTRANHVNSAGNVPAELGIAELWWSIQGFSSVRLLWDQTAQEVAAVLAAGNGARLMMTFGDSEGLLYPQTAIGGGSGNLLVTTSGAVSGATYDILMKIRFSGT
jgi:hypothetical protein